MKKVIILGSTGTIGQNTIEVIRRLKGFKIVGLAAFRNHRRLLEQARLIKPRYLTLLEERTRVRAFPRAVIRIGFGENSLLEMIDRAGADIMICALSSTKGIRSVLRGIDRKMRICLATKEILVSFGEIVMRRVTRQNAELIPVDSEHSALYQCLRGETTASIRNIFLTASGGPFLNKSIKNVKKSDVLRHPVWKMGQKITVDSATLMNKGLEVIEAHYLFGLPSDKIKVVIHPEAICHSLVQFIDGSIKAQFSYPDMKLPIQYALTAPERRSAPVPHIDMNYFQNLNFIEPDFKKFTCLSLAYEALRIGRSMPAVLNGANAETVKQFLEDRIKFSDIPSILDKTMNKHIPYQGDIDGYLAAEEWAHIYVRKLISKKNN